MNTAKMKTNRNPFRSYEVNEHDSILEANTVLIRVIGGGALNPKVTKALFPDEKTNFEKIAQTVMGHSAFNESAALGNEQTLGSILNQIQEMSSKRSLHEEEITGFIVKIDRILRVLAHEPLNTSAIGYYAAALQIRITLMGLNAAVNLPGLPAVHEHRQRV